jgi:tripartite-type tricarboxylate transporter receptor subunit TctC
MIAGQPKIIPREIVMKRIGLILALCVAFGTAPAVAQDRYPSKPVKIIVPYAPGGATDIVARILGEQLRQTLGQSFVVENKPGANGIVALNELQNARPDGYTLMIGNVTTNTITPVLTPAKLPNYDKNVVPISRLVDIPEFLIVTNTNFSVKALPELVDYAKKNPGKLRYGTTGAGSYPHYDMAFFAKKAGDLDLIAIHNKAGASGVINDMITGDTQASFLNVASTAAQIKAGKLRPLALVNHQRLPEFPDVPVMQEIGYPGVGTIAWQGLFAPAGTPKEVLEVMFKASVQALQAPSVIEAFKKQNFNIVPNKSLDDAKAWLADEMKTWKDITTQVKIETAE